MKKLTVTVAAAALVLGSLALAANAQTQQPGSFRALAKDATPLVTQARCGPHAGRWCGPWHHRVCGPNHCWCAHC